MNLKAKTHLQYNQIWLIHCFVDGFNLQGKQTSTTGSFHMCTVAIIKNILSQDDAEKLVCAFMYFMLDCSHSLQLGFPKSSLKSLIQKMLMHEYKQEQEREVIFV